ncbi:LysR substrate-binding domain-containing protein [Sphingobium sp. AN641]|uniref:LysR substrate-binding domain-containing protein n=1 Tax=Sphingobium sp. AN641 TaxID=3133443 RepID=UPI0030C0089C
MPVNLPTNMLRSFVAIVDAGSMLGASDRVFVTQSALSLQIKRLEELVQQTLFLREGRRLNLTPIGGVLLDYARRVLLLHDEAVAAVSSGRFAGPVRIGMVQDFADNLLTGLLSRFSELHPQAQIFARVAGTVELQTLLARGELDILLGFAAPSDSHAVTISPIGWYGEAALADRAVIPLVVLEEPCRFREAAIRELDNAGIAWRIVVETPNLATLKASVDAGLGITCRTPLFLGESRTIEHERLPALPRVAAILRTADALGEAAQRLAELAREAIEAR